MSLTVKLFPPPRRGSRPALALTNGADCYRERVDVLDEGQLQAFVTGALKRFPGLVNVASELRRAIDAKVARFLAQLDSGQREGGATGKTEQLVGLALDKVELFHAADGVAFASVHIENHKETWPVRSRGFKRWLERLCWKDTGAAAGSAPTLDALGILEGTALFEGEQHEVYLRVGAPEPEVVCLDLGDPEWRVVRIDPTGWRIDQDRGVRFRRSSTLAPLPEPVPGGSLDELRELVNLPDDGSFRLLVAWLVSALRARPPFCVATVSGEQGSAKSSFAYFSRQLADPAHLALRSSPRDARDLAIAGSAAWVVAFDNISSLEPWLSDAICRLASGAGFGTRRLYTDDEEAVFGGARPVLLNGIPDLATRADLGDRALCFHLPRIGEQERRTEADLKMRFAEARPRLLGALLDALAGVLRTEKDVHLDRPPRMADFARTGVALEQAAGWPPNSFLDAYRGNRRDLVEVSLDADPVAGAVQKFMGQRRAFSGSAADLLEALAPLAGETVLRSRGWPTTPAALGRRLRRLAPSLRAVGVDVTFVRTSDARGIRILKE